MMCVRLILLLYLLGTALSHQTLASDELKRIVSLSPAITAMLHELGREDRLVGVTRYCRQAPDNPRKLIVVGGAADPQVETILTLKPDIVLASSLLPENIEKRLIALGIPVQRFRQDRLRDILQQVEWLGEHTASSDAAKHALTHARNVMNRARVQNANLPHHTGLLVFSGEMNLVAGGGTYASEVMEFAGLENVAASLLQSWPTISHEWLLAQNPHWILVATRKSEVEDQLDRKRLLAQWREHPIFSRLTAVQAGRVITIPQSRLVVPSLQVFEVMDSLRQQMQLFPEEGKLNHALD
ncbi:MAG: helical backbone metal receptor [Verrucomicrobiota bacterium]